MDIVKDHRREEIKIIVNDLIEDVKTYEDDFNLTANNDRFSYSIDRLFDRIYEHDHVCYYSDAFSFLETPFITFEMIELIQEYDNGCDISNSVEVVNEFVRIVMNDIISEMDFKTI